MWRWVWVALFLIACDSGSLIRAGEKKPGEGTPPKQEPSPGKPPAQPPGAPAWPGPQGLSFPKRNPIPAENRRPGEPAWDQIYDAWDRQIEGYASRISARAGDRVSFMLSASRPGTVRWALYRIGWYQGAGARKVAEGGPIPVPAQPPCPIAEDSGMVRCQWKPVLELEVEADWLSGLYALKAVRDDGYTRFVPLVIVDDRPADIVLQANVTTYQAYNAWGGTSLYVDATGRFPLGRATRVSFDRPYDGDKGAGQMFRYEAGMARFLERHGYDVTYITNIDIHHQGVAALRGRKVFLDAGHDEYWSAEQRAAMEAARDAGMPLLFLGANTAYWKIRLEEPAGPSNPRVITCYKGRSEDDPVQGAGITGRFRDPPINRPEDALVGVMYESWQLLSVPWVVTDPEDFLYRGTGLRRGDVIPALVGYEYDRRFPGGQTPANFRRFSRSPVIDAEGRPGWAEGGWYRAASGALVATTGSIEWVLGLDTPGRADPRVERMTANLLHEAAGLPIPPALQRVEAPPPPRATGPFAQQVRTLARGLGSPAGLSAASDGSLVVADPRRHQILRVDATGKVEVLAGDGQLSANPAYDNVPGKQARFFGPTAVLAQDDGIVVADTYNHCIRKILDDPQRTVITLAGRMGARGDRDGVGEEARFFMPMGLALDPVRKDILVADTFNHRIRRIETGSWKVETVAGAGAGDRDGPLETARFTYPTSVLGTDDGSLFVLATGNGKLLRIDLDSGTVRTLAGGGLGFADGSGDRARLAPQGGLAWRGDRLLVGDAANYRIRAILPGFDAPSTLVWTWAGSGRFGDRDGRGDNADIPLPVGLAVDASGKAYVADGNGAIRVIE